MVHGRLSLENDRKRTDFAQGPAVDFDGIAGGGLWVAATTIGLVVGLVFYTLTSGELLVGTIMPVR